MSHQDAPAVEPKEKAAERFSCFHPADGEPGMVEIAGTDASMRVVAGSGVRRK